MDSKTPSPSSLSSSSSPSSPSSSPVPGSTSSSSLSPTKGKRKGLATGVQTHGKKKQRKTSANAAVVVDEPYGDDDRDRSSDDDDDDDDTKKVDPRAAFERLRLKQENKRRWEITRKADSIVTGRDPRPDSLWSIFVDIQTRFANAELAKAQILASFPFWNDRDAHPHCFLTKKEGKQRCPRHAEYDRHMRNYTEARESIDSPTTKFMELWLENQDPKWVKDVFGVEISSISIESNDITNDTKEVQMHREQTQAETDKLRIDFAKNGGYLKAHNAAVSIGMYLATAVRKYVACFEGGPIITRIAVADDGSSVTFNGARLDTVLVKRFAKANRVMMDLLERLTVGVALPSLRDGSIDGFEKKVKPEDLTPLLDPVTAPAYGAFAVFRQITIPEMRLVLENRRRLCILRFVLLKWADPLHNPSDRRSPNRTPVLLLSASGFSTQGLVRANGEARLTVLDHILEYVMPAKAYKNRLKADYLPPLGKNSTGRALAKNVHSIVLMIRNTLAEEQAKIQHNTIVTRLHTIACTRAAAELAGIHPVTVPIVLEEKKYQPNKPVTIEEKKFPGLTAELLQDIAAYRRLRSWLQLKLHTLSTATIGLIESLIERTRIHLALKLHQRYKAIGDAYRSFFAGNGILERKAPVPPSSSSSSSSSSSCATPPSAAPIMSTAPPATSRMFQEIIRAIEVVRGSDRPWKPTSSTRVTAQYYRTFTTAWCDVHFNAYVPEYRFFRPFLGFTDVFGGIVYTDTACEGSASFRTVNFNDLPIVMSITPLLDAKPKLTKLEGKLERTIASFQKELNRNKSAAEEAEEDEEEDQEWTPEDGEDGDD